MIGTNISHTADTMYKLLLNIQSGDTEEVCDLLEDKHSYYEFILELAIRLGDTQGQYQSSSKYIAIYKRIRFIAGVLYRANEEVGTLLPTALKKLSAIRIGEEEYSYDGLIISFNDSIVNYLRQGFKSTLRFLYDVQKIAIENVSTLSGYAKGVIKQITIPQIKIGEWKYYAKKIAAMHIRRERDEKLIEEINVKLLETPRERSETQIWKPMVEILLISRNEDALLTLAEMFAGDHGKETVFY